MTLSEIQSFNLQHGQTFWLRAYDKTYECAFERFDKVAVYALYFSSKGESCEPGSWLLPCIQAISLTPFDEQVADAPLEAEDTSKEDRALLLSFATAALTGFLASPTTDFTLDAGYSPPMTTWKDYAKGAFQIAQAMLEESRKH